MALRLTSMHVMDDEENENKRTGLSGVNRLKAMKEEQEDVPQPAANRSEPETEPTGVARLQALKNGQKQTTVTPAPETPAPETPAPAAQQGRIRPGWDTADAAGASAAQDRREKPITAAVDDLRRLNNAAGVNIDDLREDLTQRAAERDAADSALGQIVEPWNRANATAQNLRSQVAAYETKLGMLQNTMDNSDDPEERRRAQQESQALDLYYQKAQRAAERYESRFNDLNTQFQQLAIARNKANRALETGMEQYDTLLSLGDKRAATLERQAEEIRNRQRSLGAGLYQMTPEQQDEYWAMGKQANDLERAAARERGNYAQHLYNTQGAEKANAYLSGAEAGNRAKAEANGFIGKVLNTAGGAALNFTSGVGSTLITLARIMELPEDALYWITGDERFNLDREPYLRNSTALQASDTFREEAERMKGNAGSLGSKIIDISYAAGNMMGASAFAGEVLGAIGNSGAITNLESIANSSPLLTSRAARYGARLGAGVLKEIVSNPGNFGVAASSAVNNYSTALANGATFEQAMSNGLQKGVLEYLSNKMFSGTPFVDAPGQQGYVTKLIEYAAGKLGKSGALAKFNASTGGKVLNWFLDKSGEGLEEVITAIGDPLIDRITYDRDADLATADELVDEYIGGVLLSLLMTGGEKILTGPEALRGNKQISDFLVENWGMSKAEADKYAPKLRKAIRATEEANQAAAAIQRAEEADRRARGETTPAAEGTGITEAPEAANENTPPVQGAVQSAPQTALQQKVDKYAREGKLSGQDARDIMADPRAMQTLIDAGLITGREMNDSEGRRKVTDAAEKYIRNVQAEEQNGPPVPGEVRNAAETAGTVQETEAIPQAAAETRTGTRTETAESPTGRARLEAAMAAEGQTAGEATPRTEGLRLPTARETLAPAPERVNLLANNRTEGTNNGTAAAENTGADVSDRNGRRGSGLRAGEQAGQVGRSPEGWRTLSRPEKAAARRAYADDVGVQPVQAKSLGVTAAAEDSTVRVYPREAWEPDLQRIAGKVEKATGKPVTFVLGAMKVNTGGVALTVRGVNTGKGIIVQADDPSISAEKIATHEAFHAFAAQDPELSAKVLKQIRQQFPENRLREIAGTYLDKLYGIVDLDSTDKSVISKALERVRDEICADAYAGINAFSANADEYTGAARQAVTEARREAAAATERKTGPPAESKLRIGNQTNQEEQTMEVVNVNIDEATESANAIQYSADTWNESDYVKERKAAAMDLAKRLGISERKALKFIDDVNGIAKMIVVDRDRLDYEASPGRSSFIGNTEYGGTIDFSTICKKRRLYTGTMEAIQKAMPDQALTAEEMLQIRSMMKDKGYEVSCGLCYVEGSRVRIGKYTLQFLDELKDSGLYVPTMAEMNTVTGQEKIRREHPEVYERYVKFMNKLAQRKPKLFQMATAYNGEILQKFKNDTSVKEKNRHGGLRLQSFSDFEIVHLIDNMQVIMDMARVGLAGQAYTKVPDFAWALGNTGLKINLSLIAKGVDENGRIILDEVEGMKRADAEALRNAYSKNVGTILVTFDDAQLKAAMNDPFIDFIIPFHRSQWKKAQYGALGLPSSTRDYTMQQNEKYIQKILSASGKATRPENLQPNDYWDFKKSGKQNAETYLKLCAENNRRPKFYKLLVNNGDGSYSLQKDGSTDGYWKLLIDFKMYDNSGKGSPQLPVKPEFNMEQSERMLNEYTGGHQSFPVAHDIVDEFLAGKGVSTGETIGEQYSAVRASDIYRTENDFTQPMTIEEFRDKIKEESKAESYFPKGLPEKFLKAITRKSMFNRTKLYRGIEAAELDYLMENGFLKSNGSYNFQNQQGQTMADEDPGYALSYATGFAPKEIAAKHYEEGQPSYLVEFLNSPNLNVSKNEVQESYTYDTINQDYITRIFEIEYDPNTKQDMVRDVTDEMRNFLPNIGKGLAEAAHGAPMFFRDKTTGTILYAVQGENGWEDGRYISEKDPSMAFTYEQMNSPVFSKHAPDMLGISGNEADLEAMTVGKDGTLVPERGEQYSAADTDAEYEAAVEAGDMETAQRMVDEAAKAAGYTMKAWHQTAKDFTVFSTDNPVAGKNDSETPNGIFFKTNDHDIGLEGKKQMAVVINPGRTLNFKDRKEANAWYRNHVEGYESLSKRMESALNPINKELQNIEDKMFADGTTDEEYNRLDKEWDNLLERMLTEEDRYRGQLRDLLDAYFLGENRPYDSIHLEYDGHRYIEGKRENVETYIVFSNKQAKSAAPVTYDAAGKPIPLSERFNTKETDIRYSAAEDEEYIPESAAEYGQLKRQGKVKAPKITKPVSKSTAAIAKADLRKALLTAYSIPGGSRGEIGKMIDALADQYLKDKSISWNDREDLINKLWESGVMHMEADDGFQAVRELVNRGRIYVPEGVKHEFGDDWNSFRREAMGEGIYLVNDESAAGWDQWNAELSDAFPGLFSEDEYDPRSFLERVVDLARKGKGENLTLAEYAAKTGGVEYATAEDMMDNLERQADYALKAFAEKANLEIYLKDRTGVKIAQERQRMGELMDKAVARERERGDKRVKAAKESGANALAKEKQREEDRRKKEREHRKEVAQRLRERQAMRELQQKTLKQLQWLSQNQNKFPAEAKKQVQDLLEDMDVLAVSTAEEMHIDNATGKTWKDLRDMYLEAKEKDPNWMPSAQLEKIVMRLDAKKIGDLDMSALQDLYKAAIGMRTELYNRNNLINDELHRTLDEVYESAKTEIQEAKGGFKAGLAQRYADMQLTPMNRFLKMAGWNPDSTWYGMAKGLEAGERAQRKFKTESQRQIAPVLEQYRDWMKTADGQGKNAKWYEIKVPESWEYHMGDKPIFSDKTVTVYMTPAQKVHMYLESKNLDNLRHMEGGRTFADKELYSKGKRAEAFANGTTVRLLPETVKSIVSDLTAEEQTLANALEQYYNNFSKQQINKVSNILYGYDKAMGGYYAPIFTNDNYTKSDPGVFDLTAEGVGNLKERQHSANPSWNISAFDAFERSVDRTGKFVGLAIPIRNMNTLWNWRESGNSMKDVVSHKWNKPGTQFVSDLMTELQSGRDITHPKIEQLTNSALSKYIGATFGFNPSIVLKQFASFPLAGTYLGYDNLIKGILRPAADTDLISKYTGELDYRLLGYATPETATLKNNPNKLQEKGFLNFVFGGGAITWMDGLTVRTLWNGAEQKVKSEQPDLKVGTQEQIDAGQSPFYQAVAKEFEEAVSRSQPMYDTMHRADVMREGDPITRTFTLFKTVPMQELNMLAQTIGEANYYKSIGADKATQTAARQKAGRAFLGILTGNLMIGVISFLNALLKNGAKAYKDKDGKLTAKSVATGMLKQYAKDAAGLALGGSEAADILSAILFGDKWYGLETPGIEQISSIIEKTIKASTKTANMVKDSVDVLENGGDWFKYMRDHGGDYVSSVEEIGRMLATYGTGLPVDNVKAYLLGAAQHISPYIKTAYEDVVSKADKSGLKGLKGAALEMRTGHILQDRAGETSERTVETIAGLYDAGYTDAVPATIQSSYSVNGETRKLSAAEDQLYRQVWRDSVSGALDDLTRDKVFRNMGQADQAKVLKKLYDYGAQNAKETVWPDYSPDKWVTTAKDLEEKDVPLSEWLPIQQELSKISGKNKKQDIKDYIDSLPYSRDQKKAMYTAAGYQDADEVRWHTGAYGSGKGKTYAPADLSWLERAPRQETTGLKLPTPERREPISSGLKLQSTPAAKPAAGGLKLR